MELNRKIPQDIDKCIRRSEKFFLRLKRLENEGICLETYFEKLKVTSSKKTRSKLNGIPSNCSFPGS
jgi:hypothetical protein